MELRQLFEQGVAAHRAFQLRAALRRDEAQLRSLPCDFDSFTMNRAFEDLKQVFAKVGCGDHELIVQRLVYGGNG